MAVLLELRADVLDAGDRATAQILLEAEELFHEQFPHGTILRSSGIYGPGRTRLIDKLRPGDSAADAAAAAAHLLTMDAQALTLRLGTDDQPVPEREVLEHLAQELGAPIADDEPADEALRRTTKRLSTRRLRGSGFEFPYLTYREGSRSP